VLAYNVISRERMALSTSVDGGLNWKYYATLDNGTSPTVAEGSDTYPTIILSGSGAELLTTWSSYCKGCPAVGNKMPARPVRQDLGSFSTIKLARTALPPL
jgi:hypothetical protein